MISKKEYLHALSIVQDYHAQIYQEVSAVLNKRDRLNNNLVDIEKFAVYADISVRLSGALRLYLCQYPEAKVIGDVEKSKLLKLKNVGKRTVMEFEKEKDQYFKIYE